MSSKNSFSQNKQKEKILWISVSFFGLIIFLVWAYNFFFTLKLNLSQNTTESPQKITEFKKQLEKINKDFKKNIKSRSDKERADIILNEKEKELVQKIKEKMEKNHPSSENPQSANTQDSTKNKPL